MRDFFSFFFNSAGSYAPRELTPKWPAGLNKYSNGLSYHSSQTIVLMVFEKKSILFISGAAG
jgi:hypothetical protein